MADGLPVAAGSEKLMVREGLEALTPCEGGTAVHVARDGRYLGCVLLSDRVKDTAARAVEGLKSRGIRTVMLTGDREETGQAVAARLGLDEVHARLLPHQKVARVEELLSRKREGRALV